MVCKRSGLKNGTYKSSLHSISHFILDIRLEYKNTVILIETESEINTEDQLKNIWMRKRLYIKEKIICILASTNNDEIKVWKFNY